MKINNKIASFIFIVFAVALLIVGCDLFHKNSAPEITSNPTTQVNEKTSYEYNLSSYDAEGDSVNYYLDVKPNWLSISGNKISGTSPAVSADTNYPIKIMASDGEDFSEQDYILKVKNVPDPDNNPPEITSTPVTQSNENSYYEYNLEAEDADEDDELDYSLVSGPSWLSILGNKIYGTTPEVYQDSSVSVRARVSDGEDSDDQSYILNIDNVPAPAVSQEASLSGEVDINYQAHLKDVSNASREVFYNENPVDSLSKEITNKNYSEILEQNKKGFWKFVLSADGATSDEKTVEVPNYNPTADVSGLEGMLDFEQGEIIALALPTPTDKNPEDNPVKYSGVESLDDKVSARMENDSLYITNKKFGEGNYSIKLSFGNENNGEGEATIEGEITKTIPDWFNPHITPSKDTYYFGSGDANKNSKIDSLDLEDISNGIQTDEANVDGMGIVDYEDGQLLEDYLERYISYLPGHYEKLETMEERANWIDKFPDKSNNTNRTYNNTGNDTTRWVSGNYASQLCINSFGYYNDDLPFDKYDLSENRKFNLPVYYVHSSLKNPDGSSIDGHGMNAILIGNDAKNFYDWYFIEPQTDETGIEPGSWNMTIPGRIFIHTPNHFGTDLSNKDMLKGDLLLAFKIDESGNASYIEGSAHEDLVVERP